MFKKKPIYIAGIVFFTLILIADLVIYFIPAGGGMGGRPSFNGEEFNAENLQGEIPEDSSMAENGEMPEGFGGGRPQNGENPEGFTMPENGERPEGFNKGNFSGKRPQSNKTDEDSESVTGENSENQQPPEMPEGFNEGNFSGSGRGNSSALGTLRKAFVPILIISILGDAACIFMLIRIKKRERKSNSAGGDDEGSSDDEDSHGEIKYDETGKKSKQDKTNTMLSVIAVGIVVAVIISNLASGSNTSEMIAENEILENEATIQNISSTFLGSGTLQSSDAEAIEIPSSVTVTSYTVKNGQSVKKGDVIANVDKKSVRNAIYETQKLIDEMDEEIADVKSDTVSSTITARADGRIKAIYAKKGESVSSAMYNNEALIVISLGGSMSVDISTKKSVKTGQTVSVALSDGEKIEGKVQQVKNSIATITVTDNGTELNDTVTVSSQDGKTLGKGKLYVSSPLKVTGYAGTIKSIHVTIGDKVSLGDKLLTVENTQDNSRYQQLLREREELTELVSLLSQMYKDGTAKAATNGVVSQLSSDIDYAELEKNNDDDTAASTVAYSSNTDSSSLIKPISLSVSPSKMITQLTASLETSISNNEATQATTESSTQPTQPTIPDNDKNEPSADQGENLNPPSQTQQKDGKYAGTVTKISYCAMYININQTDMTDKDISSLEELKESSFNIPMQYEPDSQITVNMYKDGEFIKSSVSAIQSGDKVYIYVKDGAVIQIDYIAGTQINDQMQGTFPGTDSNQNTLPEMNYSESTSQDNANTGSLPNGNFTSGNTQIPSGSGSFSSRQTTPDEDEEEATYIVDKKTLYAITPAETMSIKVSVDELDVLALKEGQTANITLDSLPGQSIKGTVKKVAAVGSAEDGGGTKYTATITVSRIDEMLDGMNASIVIETSTQKNVLTIPAAAVYEDGNRTFVYTSAGNGEEELKNPVEITTGASDGTNIEVLEGLTEGDTIYYNYADSVTYRTEK